MSYEYLENLPPEASSRYFDKLQKVCVEKCPYKEPADKWVDNPKQWPPIQYNDLYHYLIKSPRKFFKRFLKKYHCYCVVKISTFLQGRLHVKSLHGSVVVKVNTPGLKCLFTSGAVDPILQYIVF